MPRRLRDAAYFEACKSEPGPDAKLLCLQSGWKAPTAATCDVAGEVEDF